MSEQKTVRVRIAVAIDGKGNWSAYGFIRPADCTPEASDGYDADEATETLNLGESVPSQVVFVEADVPLPQSVTVEGEVVK